MKLKIIHTNDIHSNFENFSRAVSIIRENKEEADIILDGGDFADFKSIELQGTKGIAAVELLESAGYDAITIGNNEMFNGPKTLEHMACNSNIPFISNNLFRKEKNKFRGVVSSTILERNNLRIMITGSSPDLEVFNDGLGIHVAPFKQAIQKEIEKHHGEFDICILLSHIGTDADTEIAREIDGIDVIISAHDHQLYTEAKIINGKIMNSAGSLAEYVGILEIEVIDGNVEMLNSKMLSTDTSKTDEEIMKILKTNKEKAVKALSRPLYTVEKLLWHDVIEENPLSNLIADGLRDLLDCDMGLINSGIVNAGVFNHISDKKLIEICPSPLNPTSFEVKGKHIKASIENSLDAQFCLADGRGPGFRGKYAGRLHVSGAWIDHDGEKVIDMYINGSPLKEEQWYRVASSDYLQRGSGYPALANNKNVVYRPEEIRDVIRQYACRYEFIEKAYVNRWSLNSSTSVTVK